MHDVSNFSFSSRPTEKEVKVESNVDWEAAINDRCICGEKAESVDNIPKVIWCESPVSPTSLDFDLLICAHD